MIGIAAIFRAVIETAAHPNGLDFAEILVRFRPPAINYDGVECVGQIVAPFDRDFVMRTPIELESDWVLFLRINSREILGGLCVETQALGRAVSTQKLADGKPGYLIHIL